jgi:hypothetical protein
VCGKVERLQPALENQRQKLEISTDLVCANIQSPLEHKQKPYYFVSMIRNPNMGSARASRSAETFATQLLSRNLTTSPQTEPSMPKNQVSDLITDQEIAFALLILSGTMNDRQAAQAVGLNPDTAAYTKAKPRVVAFMHEHRAAVHERLVQQESEEVRRLKLGRERVLARLWEIADLDPDMTRNSMSAQIKALSMIVAIEGLIPDRNTGRRTGSAQNKSAPSPVHPQVDTAAWLREQQGKTTGPQPGPDPARDEDVLGVPHPPPGGAADAPSHLGSTPTPSAPHAPVSASAPDNRVPSSMEKKPDTWRLRL